MLQLVFQKFPDLNPDWLLLGTGPMLRDGRELTPKPAAPTEPEKQPEAGSFGQDVELVVLRRLLADREEQIQRKDSQIADLNQRLGKPFNGLDAAGHLLATPRNPIGFGAHKLALSVSHRVKNKGAARPL